MDTENFGLEGMTDEQLALHKEMAEVSLTLQQNLQGKHTNVVLACMLNVFGGIYMQGQTSEERQAVLDIMQDAITKLPELAKRPRQLQALYDVNAQKPH